MKQISKLLLVLLAGVSLSQAAQAACKDVSYATLQAKATEVQTAANTDGLGLKMWVTMVDETGIVCNVVNTGDFKGATAGNEKWLGSRVISAQKANTANAFSLDSLSISSGALYAVVQPGGSLFGLQESNPVNAAAAYAGSAKLFGSSKDPMKGKRIGGVNVFGGGIALYSAAGKKIGAIGVSGDTSCTDHAFAWKVRAALGFDNTPVGDFEKLKLTATFADLGDHPVCTGSDDIQTADFGFVVP